MVDKILSQRLAEFSTRQDETLGRLRDEQTKMISETTDKLAALVEAALRKRADTSEHPRGTKTVPNKVRSITEAPSRQRGGTQEIDKVIWPLLNTGLTVRAIALRANTSTATVGRSRQRWEAAQQSVSDETEDGETAGHVI